MRIKTLILIFGITFISCDSDENDPNQTENLDGTWNLTKSTSSENIDNNYEEIFVTYTFNSSTASLTVTNNAIETTDLSPKPSGRLANGTYSYNSIENDEGNFLVIQNQEIGKITFEKESLILNQAITSDGTEIPEFILNFER